MEDSGEIEFGELLDESFDFKQITWTVQNVFSLSNCVDYEVQSPSFSFEHATWKLEMYPNGKTEWKSQGFIDLILLKLDSRIPEHNVSFKFYFKTHNGKEFKAFSHYHCFNKNSNRMGITKYMNKSKLLQMKDVIAPNGVLTIACEMRTKAMTGSGRNFQIESTNFLSVFYSYIHSFARKVLETFSTRNDTDNAQHTQSRERKQYCIYSDLKHTTPLHDNQVLRDFKEFFLKQENCDVLIKVKGVEFNAHRAILSARSPVFASTFLNDMKEKATGIIDIEDCDPSSFSDFLCFLYCGDIQNISVENMFSLFTAADKYDVSDLRSECIKILKKNLSIDTFCDTITLALQHSDTELIKLATKFFTENLQEIILTVKWQSFIKENPIQSNELIIKALEPYKNKQL